MRTGWDHEHLYGVENAPWLQNVPVLALLRCMGVHVFKMYDGKADWEILGEVKKNLTRIPLIGNGDVRSLEDAKRMIDISGRRWRHDWTQP